MTQNRSEAYQRKIEYNKLKSKYTRHLYPHKRHEQNEKSKLRGQDKRMRAYLQKKDTVRILKASGAEVPWYLQNLQMPREYRISVKPVERCPLNCRMCEEARKFFHLTENHITSRYCEENCRVCNVR